MQRLVLFDIDGTLVRGGPAKDAFRVALTKVYGTAGRAEEWEFSGKTDPEIARELMEDAGLAPDVIDGGLDALWAAYLEEMETRIDADPPRVLPGVPELVDALEGEGATALGLVTGNILGGARLKLSSARLDDRFPIGGFGSDHAERNRLPAVALRRAEARWGVRFRADDVVVVGDTPRDVECGRYLGARTLAVATGRFDHVVLEGTGADRVFRDLSETEEVLEEILGRNGRRGLRPPGGGGSIEDGRGGLVPGPHG